MANLIITIDGPAASGKTSVAMLLAGKLDAGFLDTGAMYRAVTLAAMQAGVDLSNEEKLLDVLTDSELKFTVEKGKMTVRLNGADITEKIRQPEITANAHYIASAPKVRAKLVRMQRKIAACRQKIVTEGRDQGTVVFPDADIKFYLTAQPAERAKRRQAQLRAKGSNETLEQIRSDIERRDKSDQTRTVGPLTPAGDAVIIDTTDLTMNEVAKKLLCYVEKCLKDSRK